MMHLRLLSATPRPIASISLAFPATRWAAVVARPRGLQQLIVRRGFSSSSANGPTSSDGFFKRVWAKYNALLVTHPLSTKIVTGGTIAMIGDVNCQLFLEPAHQPFNVKRAAIFTLLGGVFISPILHVWYGFLGRAVPGSSTLAIAKRLALDQLVFAPAFLPIFFTALLTLEGDVAKVPEKLQNDWWPAVTANWVVWVPAQLVNFRFVPGSLQVLFSNVVGLFWNSYLSFLSHSDAHLPVASAKANEEVNDVVAVAKPLLTSEQA